ncbi:MAG: hypothetical protein ACI9TH_001921, partial [Kiritimatiellia bacterium]
MAAITNRRHFLHTTAGGFGGVALSHLLSEEVAGIQPHYAPKAKRVIQLFMNGGVSQMDTFDPKPRLNELHDTTFDPGEGQRVESVTSSPGFKVLKSPFEFKQYGECGRWVSRVFPHMAGIVDDLAFLMSMTSPTNVHGLGSYMQNTGFTQPGFPCMGAWISYALGKLNRNLPEFIVMPDPKGLPYNNRGNFSAGFLPAKHTGTVIRASSDQPINYLMPPKSATTITSSSESDARSLLAQLDRTFADRMGGDTRLDARMES